MFSLDKGTRRARLLSDKIPSPSTNPQPVLIMSCLIVDLPIELQLMIIECIPRDDIGLISLSTMNRSYRELTAPSVFHTIKFRGTREKTCISVRAVADGIHARHVKELQYVCSYRMKNERREEEQWMKKLAKNKRVLHNDAKYILSNLKLFPNLEHFTTAFWFGPCMEWHEGDSEFDGPGPGFSQQSMMALERQEPWRAFMVESYNAIIRNPRVKGFRMLHLFPTELSTFTNPKFWKFLKRVETFDISLGSKRIEGEHHLLRGTATYDQYGVFVEKLYNFFFAHLKKTKSLRFSPAVGDTIGGNTGCLFEHHPSPMLDWLRILRLGGLFIRTELVKFLASHSTLEYASLHGCRSGALKEDGDDEFPSWVELFDALITSENPRLRKFDITGSLVRWHDIVEQNEGIDCPVSFASLKHLFDEKPERPVLPYTYFEDDYGRTSLDIETICFRTKLGSDQQSYDTLMNMIKSNRENHANEKEMRKREKALR